MTSEHRAVSEQERSELEPDDTPNEANEEGDRRSRRSFMFFGALAAATLLPKQARAQGRVRQRRVIEPQPDPQFATARVTENIAAFTEWDAAGVTRLVRRVTNGIIPGEMTKATELGWNAYLNYQLNYSRINDDACEQVISSIWPLMSQTSDALFSANADTVRNSLRESTLFRASFSKRQLYQRMVEFWTDHFNMDVDKIQYLIVADQRDVIRKHALGNFQDLLKASAHSAAMMAYLDQNTSRNTAPNQNYAREIMELHTLGVDGGYTQTDVAELSRVLTGWTIQGRGQFTFNPAIHDWGAKTVLNLSIPAGSPSQGQDGILEGEKVLDMLVNHPSTAKFIAKKMLKWLLTPEPTDTQINAVVAAYRATKGDIKTMIRVILNESWLNAAPMKLKRPFHFLASSLRSLAPTVASITTVNNQLTALGHVQFAWDTPDGYPDKVEYWAGNIVPKWNTASSIANLNSAATVLVDTSAYRAAGSTAAAIDMIDQNFFGGEMPLVTRNGLLTYAGTTALNEARTRELLSLAMSSNAFQWY